MKINFNTTNVKKIIADEFNGKEIYYTDQDNKYLKLRKQKTKCTYEIIIKHQGELYHHKIGDATYISVQEARKKALEITSDILNNMKNKQNSRSDMTNITYEYEEVTLKEVFNTYLQHKI